MDKVNVRKQIQALLMRDDEIGDECRNDDNFLGFYYMYEYHSEESIIIDKFVTNTIDIKRWAKIIPPLDYFKRVRADFQNQKGLYLAHEEIRAKREGLANDYRKEFGKSNR